ncbi:YcaO-like family protein [Arcanobacterium phocisimile]|uniref:YcaO-like family protein n=1 Tax=Arcanobacterium phocisimile TaxID=1302235 RepID=A0ABX7IHY0_9ACTO|nr:YcaO-like family protein [Arcanobacterium phocisimile]QRV02743.1 YcaO-like family protein [Arcanobacterium phocisimile]
MFSLCLEARHLSEGRTLIHCVDDAKIIVTANTYSVIEEIKRAEECQDLDCLGVPLKKMLLKHGSVLPIERPCNEAVIAENDCHVHQGESGVEVLVCGYEPVGTRLVAILHNEGVKAQYSSKTIRECSYEVIRGGFLLICRGPGSRQLFADEVRALEVLDITWAVVDYAARSFLFGPVVQDGKGARFSDCMKRSWGNAINKEVYLAELQPALWGNFLSRLISAHPAMEMLAHLVRGLIKKDVENKEGVSPLDTVWEIGLDGQLDVRAVLQCSFINGPSKQIQIHPPTYLVDSKFGIVRELNEVRYSPSMPKTLHTTQARVTDLARVAGYANTVFCQGSTLISDTCAGSERKKKIEYNMKSAIGESVERYCSNLIDLLPVIHGSYDSLLRRGYPVLDPSELVLFSEQQYAEPGFPFEKFSHDLPVSWVEGRYYGSDSPVFVPASLVYVNWYTNQYHHEPRVNFPAFAGVAAGETIEQATRSGVSEILERHATMVWWLNAQALPSIELAPGQCQLFESSQDILRPSLVHLDNTFDVPVAAGIVHNDSHQLVHVGFSCRSTIDDAALKAWSEALTLQEGALDLLNPEGVHWKAIAEGFLPGRSYKKWRGDRCYLDDFRQDMKDVDDLLVQQEVFLDPRAVRRVAHLIDRPATRQANSVPHLKDNSLASYVEKIEARGKRVIIVDITSPDVASCGLRVVRALVPGSVGNSPAAFPYLGQGVVAREAVELGWRERALTDAEINLFPMPHA